MVVSAPSSPPRTVLTSGRSPPPTKTWPQGNSPRLSSQRTERALPGLGRPGGRGDRPVLSRGIEDLFSVGGNNEGFHIIQELFEFSLREVELVERHPAAARIERTQERWRFQEIYHPLLTGGQGEIVLHGNRQGQGSLAGVGENG